MLDGMGGSIFDTWPVCANGRLVGLAPIELLLAASADAVLSLVEHYDEQVSVPFRRLTWQPTRSLVCRVGFPHVKRGDVVHSKPRT